MIIFIFWLYTFYQPLQPFKNLTKLKKVGFDLVVSVIHKWNNLDVDMRNSTSLLQLVRPSPKNLVNCHSPKGTKYEIRSRLGLSYLRENKFKHSFQDTLNSFCNCGCEIETAAHFPLHWRQFYTERNTLSTKSEASILLY